MFSKVLSSAVAGVSGTEIYVEADVSDGLPMFTMVGYLSSSVREASERVRTAIRNSGIMLPPKRITVNLSPADIRKDGTVFDLAIALSCLLAAGLVPEISLDRTMILGELGLDGSIKPVNGVLSMVHHGYSEGITDFIVPSANAREAAIVEGARVFGFSRLSEVLEFIEGKANVRPTVYEAASEEETSSDLPDFSEIRGQEMLKRGLTIAAAGFHNVLMLGAAGAGKSMLAKCLPGILPKLTFQESIEVTKIYSVSGLLPDTGTLMKNRPFRAPHHTVSEYALTGGGAIPRPGEISLAHNGVLFLDELPEFKKSALEVLRQPMEDGVIRIARVQASYTYPADFMLVAAANPCPCGYYPDRKRCRCTPRMVSAYQGKLSGPLLDRIDIRMEVTAVSGDALFEEASGETSESIRMRVEAARKRQEERYAGEKIRFNSQLSGKMLGTYIRLSDSQEEMLHACVTSGDLSARGVYRVMRLARTIADLSDHDAIGDEDLTEALFFRNSNLPIEGSVIL